VSQPGEGEAMAQARTTKHTHPVVFGRRVEGCPRCDELTRGAAPVRWRRRDSGYEAAAEVRAHFDSEKHRSGGCGPVCTFGEW